jgi:hypothetical protein
MGAEPPLVGEPFLNRIQPNLGALVHAALVDALYKGFTRLVLVGIINGFFSEVEAREGLLAGFDEELWNCTVESMTVLVGGGFRVRFKDGLEVDGHAD